MRNKLTAPEALTFPENIRTVFFDLDGTLLDSMGVWTQIDIDFLGKRNLPMPEDYLEAIVPLGFRATAEYTIRRFQLSETPEALMGEWHEMAVDAYTHHVPLKKGALPLLNRMKEKGYRLAVASASSKELVMPCLKRNGILEFFDQILTVSEDGYGKNEPAFWSEAAEKLGTEPADCLLFDDAAAALLAAGKAGMTTVGVFDRHTPGQDAVCSAGDFYTSLD